MSRLTPTPLSLVLQIMVVIDHHQHQGSQAWGERGYSPLELHHRPLLTRPKPPFRRPQPANDVGDASAKQTYMYDTLPLMPLEQGRPVDNYRPYRLTPYGAGEGAGANGLRWRGHARAQLSCYCTTAYRRHTPLAGCAVLTVRHVLTTAWSVDMVLRRHPYTRRLHRLLGWWYNAYSHWNGTRYMTPARIHFHPDWFPMHKTNLSHPFPVHLDLAVLTGLHPMEWGTHICQRAGPRNLYTSPTHVRKPMTMFWIVGSQFIRAWQRNPSINHRYAVRIDDVMKRCPKVEWGWFMCVESRWAPVGMDSGAALHRSPGEYYYQNDGLIAMNTISMSLRHKFMVHYFTILNIHPVLEFLNAAYMGTEPARFLDERFLDARHGPLNPYSFYNVPPVPQDQPDKLARDRQHESHEPLFWDG